MLGAISARTSLALKKHWELRNRTQRSKLRPCQRRELKLFQEFWNLGSNWLLLEGFVAFPRQHHTSKQCNSAFRIRGHGREWLTKQNLMPYLDHAQHCRPMQKGGLSLQSCLPSMS